MIKKSLIGLIYLIILIPGVVFAGSSDSDITFTTDFDDKYTYGDVKTCTTATGSLYFSGIEVTNGVKVCLWNTESKMKVERFTCEDSSMERFQLGSVSGSDGNSYYGYGCRKIKNDEDIEYIKKEINVGYGVQVASQYDNTCTILEGDAGEFNKHNACYLDAKKPGIIKIKVVNKSNKGVTYYEYKVLALDSSISELDSDYYYGSVGTCNLGSYLGGKVSFDSLTFCATSAAGYDYAVEALSCQDDSYDPFQVSFTSNGKSYKGYGCRKIKDPSKLEYINKQLYVGYGDQVASQYDNTCTILEGDAGEFNKHNACYLDAKKPGTVKIKTAHNKTKIANYYKYEIIAPTSSETELDSNYTYCNVDVCRLGSQGYSLGGKVPFNNYTFCGSQAAGYNFEKYSVTCEKEGYDIFQLTFSSNGTAYKGYGCRKLISDDEGSVGNQTTEKIETNDSFWGNLPVVQCGNISIPEPLPPITRIIVLFIKIAVPLVLIVMGMIDIVQAVTASDEKKMKEAQTKFIKRLIPAALIFLVVTIVQLLVGILADNATESGSLSECIDCMISDESKCGTN